MEHESELSEREQQVLHAVVYSYITTAEAVGSRNVVKRFEMDVSPATVRNTMADLEDAGFLQQLHTSSGRVPTERGYRYYVDYLMRVQKLTLEERDRIEREFETKLNDTDEVLRQTSHLLAMVTNQAGIAQAPSEHAATVRRVDLMPLGAQRVAVLIADDLGQVRTIPVQLQQAMSVEDLNTLSNFLNAHLSGIPLDDLAHAVENKLRQFFDEQRALAEQALLLLKQVPVHRASQLYLDGASQLFQQPEFQDVGKAREVIGLLEERERLMTVLSSAAEGIEAQQSAVVIGGEGTDLEGLSVVTAPYEIDGKQAGVIGILGPRRMPYSHLTSVVDYTAELVGKILTRFSQ